MRTIIGIDPGPKQHGVVGYAGDSVFFAEDMTTEELIEYLTASSKIPVACEWITSFGMAVGKEVFQTVFQIGRIYQSRQMRLIPRIDVKLHICKSTRAKDANIRQALLDRFGPVGTKKKPGPLWGVSGHRWPALAVAVTAMDLARTEREWRIEDEFTE
jgi:hypothetical protein